MSLLQRTQSALIFLAFFFLIAAAGFSPMTARGQNENLLLNGDFEEGFAAWNGEPALQVAAGWTPFWVITGLDIPENDRGARPEFMASDSPKSPFARAYTGQRAQLWHTKFSTAVAGVYQKVPVTPDSTLRLSAWTFAWSSEGNDPGRSQNGAWARQRIGIDPTGGTDPSSPNVAWSMPTQYLDSWGRISVETRAQSDHVTVFLSAYPNRHLPQNDVYFDQAELILVSFGLPTPASGGAPLIAPTIDPLLTGLVTGQGVAPGVQGIAFGGAQAAGSERLPEPGGAGMTSWLILLTLLIGACLLAIPTFREKFSRLLARGLAQIHSKIAP